MSPLFAFLPFRIWIMVLFLTSGLSGKNIRVKKIQKK